MSNTRRKSKRNSGKKPRRPNPRPGKNPFITPPDARRRAARHVAARLFKGAQVRDGATARLGIYFRDKWTAKDVWVVYRNSEAFGLKSSDVVLVCKRTGRVLYDGPALDEG